jgi:hypothetical protein
MIQKIMIIPSLLHPLGTAKTAELPTTKRVKGRQRFVVPALFQ